MERSIGDVTGSLAQYVKKKISYTSLSTVRISLFKSVNIRQLRHWKKHDKTSPEVTAWMIILKLILNKFLTYKLELNGSGLGPMTIYFYLDSTAAGNLWTSLIIIINNYFQLLLCCAVHWAILYSHAQYRTCNHGWTFLSNTDHLSTASCASLLLRSRLRNRTFWI